MTRDEVLAMAEQAGIEVHERKKEARLGIDCITGSDSTEKLMRFHALAVAQYKDDAERYRWLTALWPHEIIKLVHSFGEGPTSSDVHKAIDRARSAK